MDTASIWVAVSNTWEDLDVQPATTREAALAHLVSRVPAQEWASFAIGENARAVAGVYDTDRDRMDPVTLLAAWHGEVEENTPDRIAFGAGQDVTVYVARLSVLGAAE